MKDKKFPSSTYTFYFIYTFLLEQVNIWSLKRSLSGKFSKCELAKGVTTIRPLLSLYDPHLVIEFPLLRNDVTWENTKAGRIGWSGTLYRTMKLYRSGIGSICIKVDVENSLKPKEVLQLARMERFKFPLSLIEKSDRQKKLPEMTLLELFERTLHDIIKEARKNEIRLIWLDRVKQFGEEKEEMLLTGDKDYPYQYPYILITMGILNQEKISTREVLKIFPDEISSFIRIHYEIYKGSPPMIDEYVNPQKNLSPEEDVFVTLYPRSCLCIYKKQDEPTPTSHYYQRSILGIVDTLTLLRMRWHSYVTTETILSEGINSLCSQFRTTPKHKDQVESFEELLAKKATIQRRVALGTEGSIFEKMIPSGLIFQLYNRGLQIFGIKELEDIVFNKLRIYENILVDLRDFRRIRELKRLNKGL